MLFAQTATPPRPAYEVRDQYLRGTVIERIDTTLMYIRDAHGGIERISLRAATTYHPRNVRLASGQDVIVLGEPKGNAFVANEVDVIESTPAAIEVQTPAPVYPNAPAYPTYPAYVPAPYVIAPIVPRPVLFPPCGNGFFGCSPFFGTFPGNPVIIIVRPPVFGFPRIWRR